MKTTPSATPPSTPDRTISPGSGPLGALAIAVNNLTGPGLLDLPSTLGIHVSVGCLPSAATLWPRVHHHVLPPLLPAPLDEGSSLGAIVSGTSDPVVQALQGGAAVQMHALDSTSFASELLDVVVGLSHEAKAEGRHELRDSSWAARLRMSVDDYIYDVVSQLHLGTDGQLEGGLLNCSVPTRTGDPIHLAIFYAYVCSKEFLC